jgi:hypothetical protein
VIDDCETGDATDAGPLSRLAARMHMATRPDRASVKSADLGAEAWSNGSMGGIEWSDDALEDLLGIGDSVTQAEICDIAERELTRPHGQNPIQGVLADKSQIYYRRAVRVSALGDYLSFDIDDEDEFQQHAANYMLVYRRMTGDEQIKFKSPRRKWIVIRVLHNRDLAAVMASQASALVQDPLSSIRRDTGARSPRQ